jgi:hypothetical protein
LQPEASQEVKKEVRFVGIDIGKAKCRAAIMDPGGIILEEFTFTNNHEGIEGLASRLTLNDRVVMESTGSVWTNLYNHLDEKRIPVALANPLKAYQSAEQAVNDFRRALDLTILEGGRDEEKAAQPHRRRVKPRKNTQPGAQRPRTPILQRQRQEQVHPIPRSTWHRTHHGFHWKTHHARQDRTLSKPSSYTTHDSMTWNDSENTTTTNPTEALTTKPQPKHTSTNCPACH